MRGIARGAGTRKLMGLTGWVTEIYRIVFLRSFGRALAGSRLSIDSILLPLLIPSTLEHFTRSTTSKGTGFPG